MQCYYVIARFTETREVEVASSTSVSEVLKSCWWPSTDSSLLLKSFLYKPQQVNKDDKDLWGKFPMEVLGDGKKYGEQYNLLNRFM